MYTASVYTRGMVIDTPNTYRKHRVVVRASAEELRRYHAIAGRYGVTLAELVRAMLDELGKNLKEKEK